MKKTIDLQWPNYLLQPVMFTGHHLQESAQSLQQPPPRTIRPPPGCHSSAASAAGFLQTLVACPRVDVCSFCKQGHASGMSSGLLVPSSFPIWCAASETLSLLFDFYIWVCSRHLTATAATLVHNVNPSTFSPPSASARQRMGYCASVRHFWTHRSLCWDLLLPRTKA